MKSTDGGTIWSKSDTNYYMLHGALTNDSNNEAVLWSSGCHDTGGVWVMVVSKTTDTGASWIRYVLSSIEGLTYAVVVIESK